MKVGEVERFEGDRWEKIREVYSERYPRKERDG